MSVNSKNIIVVVFKHIWNQIHQGNFIPLIVFVAIVYYFAYPALKEIKGTQEGVGYVAVEVYELEQKFEAYKKKQDKIMSSRKAGKIGKTYH